MIDRRPNQKGDILLSLSGGMDSTIAGFLLKKEGFCVQGVYMNILEKDRGLSAAKRSAEILDIPFNILDLRKKFQEN